MFYANSSHWIQSIQRRFELQNQILSLFQLYTTMALYKTGRIHKIRVWIELDLRFSGTNGQNFTAAVQKLFLF